MDHTELPDYILFMCSFNWEPILLIYMYIDLNVDQRPQPSSSSQAEFPTSWKETQCAEMPHKPIQEYLHHLYDKNLQYESIISISHVLISLCHVSLYYWLCRLEWFLCFVCYDPFIFKTNSCTCIKNWDVYNGPGCCIVQIKHLFLFLYRPINVSYLLKPPSLKI